MPAPQFGGSNFPTSYRGMEVRGVKPLYHSDPQYALVLGKQLTAGFGVLLAGTVMAVNTSASGNVGKLVPYVKTPTDATNTDKSRAYVVADVANTGTTCKVLLADSYRFVVGDDLMICAYSSGAVYHNGGAITAIDRTSVPGIATITFTTAVAVATLTMANGASVYPEAGASTKYSTAKYILDTDVDTGSGEGSTDALASVVISNAILNLPMLSGYDSAAATDLGSVSDGSFLILK